MFFELLHLKDAIVMVIDRLLNFKNIFNMRTVKSICTSILASVSLTLLGNILLLVVSSVGVEGELTNIKSVR